MRYYDVEVSFQRVVRLLAADVAEARICGVREALTTGQLVNEPEVVSVEATFDDEPTAA